MLLFFVGGGGGRGVGLHWVSGTVGLRVRVVFFLFTRVMCFEMGYTFQGLWGRGFRVKCLIQ